MKYKSIIRIEEPSTGLCNVGKETPIEDVGYWGPWEVTDRNSFRGYVVLDSVSCIDTWHLGMMLAF